MENSRLIQKDAFYKNLDARVDSEKVLFNHHVVDLVTVSITVNDFYISAIPLNVSEQPINRGHQ